MKKAICVIKDIRSGEIYTPVPFANTDTAVRSFGDMIHTQRDTMLAAHPEDFMLLHIADYDSDCGCITAFTLPEFKVLANGSEFKNENIAH